MSKKDDSPAISLFSFQDIITSITGIMFLVVLLLLLLIFESDPIQKPPQQSEKDRQAMQALAEEIKNLKTQIDKLKSQRKELEKQLVEYQKMSPEMIEAEKIKLEELVKKLTAENIKLKLEISQAQQHELQTVDNIKRLETAYKDVVKNIEKDKKTVREKTDEIKKIEKRIETIKKTVVFSVDKNSDSKPLLAEFTANGFIVLDFVTNQTHDLRLQSKDVDAAFNKFIEWLSNRDPDSETVSIILGPASLKYWDIISLKLKDLKFRHGLELLPDDNSTLFNNGTGGGK